MCKQSLPLPKVIRFFFIQKQARLKIGCLYRKQFLLNHDDVFSCLDFNQNDHYPKF